MQKINTEELKDLFEKRTHFVLINVLSADAHKKEHICGSLNIPISVFEKKAPVILGKDEYIIVYCEGPLSKKSGKAVKILDELGFKRVARYEGGIADWKKGGNCLIGTSVIHRRAA